jgi:hypothetical protein
MVCDCVAYVCNACSHLAVCRKHSEIYQLTRCYKTIWTDRHIPICYPSDPPLTDTWGSVAQEHKRASTLQQLDIQADNVRKHTMSEQNQVVRTDHHAHAIQAAPVNRLALTSFISDLLHQEVSVFTISFVP